MFTTHMVGAASHFPSRTISNHDLEKMVDTNDQWIVERTGIKTRRVVEPGEATSDLAVKAAKKLLNNLSILPESIDAVILATVTPDSSVPSAACVIHDKLGTNNAWALDLNAACSGFIYGLSVADQFIRTGYCKNVLFIGSDVMSSIVDYKDRTTCVLFGDGASAVYLEGRKYNKNAGIIDTYLGADGSGREHLYVKAGGSAMPASHESVDQKLHYIRQNGATVFKEAVTQMADVSETILERNKISPSAVNYFIPHQANLRIIDACAKRMDFPRERVAVNIDRYGNTTTCTIPSCIADLTEDNKLKKDDLMLLAAFGAGYTYASALVRWN